MKTKTLAIILSSIILSACASDKAPQAQNDTKVPQAQNSTQTPDTDSAQNQAGVDVLYTNGLPDGSVLKEIPKEITIVKRSTTQKEVGKQVALNVVMLALGGFSAQPFGKEDLQGERIDGVNSRENLANPISNRFLDELKSEVNSALQAAPALGKNTDKEELMVQGGLSRLVYEKLEGEDVEKFRLNTKLYVSAVQKGFHFLPQLPRVVDCSAVTSDALPLEQWAVNDYELVKTRLDATLNACEKEVVAQLPMLLK